MTPARSFSLGDKRTSIGADRFKQALMVRRPGCVEGFLLRVWLIVGQGIRRTSAHNYTRITPAESRNVLVSRMSQMRLEADIGLNFAFVPKSDIQPLA